MTEQQHRERACSIAGAILQVEARMVELQLELAELRLAATTLRRAYESADAAADVAALLARVPGIEPPGDKHVS